MMSRTPFVSLIVAILAAVILVSCAQRSRDNPFDPKGTAPSPVTLSLTPGSSSITLDWSVTNISDYTGFRIYRAVDDTSRFVLLRELSAGARSYLDNQLAPYHWYYYYVTVRGSSTSSPASDVVKALPGPGDIWILSRYDYSVDKYSYDLQHNLQHYDTNYPTVDWAPDFLDQSIWLAHPPYATISRLNLKDGYSDLAFSDSLQRPSALEWLPDEKLLMILDPAAHAVRVFNGNNIIRTLRFQSDGYFNFTAKSSRELWVLNTGNLLYLTPDSARSIPFETNFEGQDIVRDRQTVYVLTTNTNLGISHIISIDMISHTSKTTTLDGNYVLLRKAQSLNYFWLVQQLSTNNYQPVKLSADYNRLLQLPASAQIADIAINPKDESVVVLRPDHYEADIYSVAGTLVTSLNNLYDPIRAVVH